MDITWSQKLKTTVQFYVISFFLEALLPYYKHAVWLLVQLVMFKLKVLAWQQLFIQLYNTPFEWYLSCSQGGFTAIVQAVLGFFYYRMHQKHISTLKSEPFVHSEFCLCNLHKSLQTSFINGRTLILLVMFLVASMSWDTVPMKYWSFCMAKIHV